MRRVTTIVVAAAVLLTTGACSLGKKQAMTDRVIRAALLVGANGGVEATMLINVTVIPSRLPIAPGPPKIVSNAAPGVKAALDFKTGRAAVGYPGADPSKAAMVFIGTRVYQRTGIKRADRTPNAGLTALATGAASLPNGVNLNGLSASAPGRAGIDSNLDALAAASQPPATPPPPPAPAPVPAPVPAPALAGTLPIPTTTSTTSTTAPSGSRLHRPIKIQRDWLEFDYSSLPLHDSTKAAGSYAISPIILERLLVGTLTGSIRQQGLEPLDGGGQVVHSSMNVSRDKAERYLPEKARKDLEKMFRANAIGGHVFKAETWVDPAGHLRRFTVRMRQTLSRIDRADLQITIDFAPATAPVTVPTPDPKATAVVKQLGQLIHGAVAR